jgi:LysM domain
MIRTFFLAALLVPAVSLAQAQALQKARDAQRVSDEGNARVERAADQASGDAPAAQRDEGAPDAGSLEGGAAAPDAGRGAVPPPDTYTVRPGDTLWDLSGRFLNNPWYWPKIWSYNPEITNPHWIYPGNLLRFYASGEEAPAQVEPVAGEDQGAEEDEEAAPVKELEDLSRADMKQPSSEEVQDAVAVAGPYKIGYVRPGTTWVRTSAFVTPHELAESGVIRSAFEEKLLLTARDRAYVQFSAPAGVKIGETYAVYKTETPVKHPITGEVIGYQSTILGAARVVALDKTAATVVITDSYDYIERGALLGPWTGKAFRAVPEKANAKNLTGVVLASPVRVVTQFAENQMVFIDRGAADGVEPGNRFTVVRAGDPYGQPPERGDWDPNLPKEDVGSLLVVDVKEHASAAMVTRSLVELLKGDRVEMRAAQ